MTCVQQALDLRSSTMLVRNLLRLSISTISYLRNFFEEDCFIDKQTTTGLRLKSLVPTSPESELVIKWLEEGVFDAFDKKYLRVCTISVCDGEDTSRIIEAYDFEIAYDSEGAPELTLSTGTSTGRHICRSKDDATEQMGLLMRRLVTMTQGLSLLPEYHVINMQLQYYDDRTPVDYQPPLFKAGEGSGLFATSDHVTIQIGDLLTQYHNVSMKVRTAGHLVPPGLDTSMTANETAGVPEGEPMEAAAVTFAALLSMSADGFTEDDVAVLTAALHAMAHINVSAEQLQKFARVTLSRANYAIQRLVAEGFLRSEEGRRKGSKIKFCMVVDADTVKRYWEILGNRHDLFSIIPDCSALFSRIQANMSEGYTVNEPTTRFSTTEEHSEKRRKR